MTRYISVLLGSLILSGCSGSQYNELIKEVSDSKSIQQEWILSSKINLNDNESISLDSLNRFSYDFMKTAAAEFPDAEFCISPLSMTVYLSMLANTTDGTTHRQILDALHISDIGILNSLMSKLLHYLPSEDHGAALGINNHFWIANRYEVPRNITSLMAETFNASMEYSNFSSPNAVAEINQWVAEKTKGLIPSILDEDWKTYISTACIFVNTSYFKGYWDSRFPIHQTRKETFHTPSGDLETDMMHQELRTGYTEDSVTRMVSLLFEDPHYQMELYLPQKDMDVSSLVSHLTPERQHTLMETTKPYYVDIALPSFSTRVDTQVKPLLNRLGISDLDNVDFSPIGLGTNPTDILHRTCLKIDESGAEGAAVTGMMVGELIQKPEVSHTSIHFDRPFLYIVRNTTTNTVLFSGTVTNPL